MPTTNDDAGTQVSSPVNQSDISLETLAERVARLEEENERQAERIDELENENESLRTRLDGAYDLIEAVRSELDDYREENERDKALLRKDVSGGSDSNESDAPTSTAGNFDTPLEYIVSLPENVVAEQLTQNQQRARFVAKDLRQYTKSIPAGRGIDSSDLRTVLSAREEEDVHTQTVSRVMNFLKKFGKSGVTITERDGKRRIAFSDDLVERLNTVEQKDGSANADVTGVVMGNS